MGLGAGGWWLAHPQGTSPLGTQPTLSPRARTPAEPAAPGLALQRRRAAVHRRWFCWKHVKAGNPVSASRVVRACTGEVLRDVAAACLARRCRRSNRAALRARVFHQVEKEAVRLSLTWRRRRRRRRRRWRQVRLDLDGGDDLADFLRPACPPRQPARRPPGVSHDWKRTRAAGWISAMALRIHPSQSNQSV